MASALARGGYGEAFLRPVFHGVGIEHEEAPIPGGHAVIHGEEAIEQVESGMVLGIGNCGIYRETFGVRLEDTVWVGDDGPVSLTEHPKVLAEARRWHGWAALQAALARGASRRRERRPTWRHAIS